MNVSYDNNGPAGRHGVKRVLVDGEHIGHVSPRMRGYEAQTVDRQPLATLPTFHAAVAHVAAVTS